MHCRANARVIFRRDQRDFAPVDFRLQVAYGVVIHLEGGDATQRTLHQFPRISTDEWHRPFAHVRPNLAKLVEGHGVEGRGFDVSCDIKLRQSAAHFRRRLDGERDRHRASWIPCFGCARISDSAGYGSRFASARARDDAHRTVHCRCGSPLRII